MPVPYTRLVRGHLNDGEVAELVQVDGLASRLHDYLESESTAIDAVHVHGAKSAAVQEIVAQLLENELNFRSEVVLTPEIGLVIRPRPDFVFRLAEGRGVLAEVERGGTTTNNHDLKDMWKAHISPDTQHLFLIVPEANWGEGGQAREKPYLRVCARLAALFGDTRRELDVVSAHVFGYGRSGPADLVQVNDVEQEDGIHVRSPPGKGQGVPPG